MTTQELVRIITMGVTAGAVPIILRYILKGKKNKKADEKNIEEENTEDGVEIKNPPAFCGITFFCALFVLCIAIYIFVFDTEEWPYGVLFIIAVFLPCLIMYLTFKLWKITVYRDHVVYRNSLGKKQTFYFQDMTWEFNEKMTKAIFYCNGKKAFVLCYYIDDTPLCRAYNGYWAKQRRKERTERKQKLQAEKREQAKLQQNAKNNSSLKNN